MLLYIYEKMLPLYTILKQCDLWTQIIKKTPIFKATRSILQDAYEDESKRKIMSINLPHFQNSMQKVPLIIKTSSITGEHCNYLTDLRSVYKIFLSLLSEKSDKCDDKRRL